MDRLTIAAVRTYTGNHCRPIEGRTIKATCRKQISFQCFFCQTLRVRPPYTRTTSQSNENILYQRVLESRFFNNNTSRDDRVIISFERVSVIYEVFFFSSFQDAAVWRECANNGRRFGTDSRPGSITALFR